MFILIVLTFFILLTVFADLVDWYMTPEYIVLRKDPDNNLELRRYFHRRLFSVKFEDRWIKLENQFTKNFNKILADFDNEVDGPITRKSL